MESDSTLQVGNVAILITDPYTDNKWIDIISQYLLLDDPMHHEAHI